MNMTYLHVLDTLNHIVCEIRANNLSIFAGAGLSVASGFVDWKKLVTRFCNILDIDVSDDFATIAQYFEEKYNRQYMCESIIKEFNSFNNIENNPNLNIIASLPVDSYWTTNYDSLIEDKLHELGRHYQKIIDQSQFKSRKPLTEVRVYKMHGDKEIPDDVVITKRDYDNYDETRWFFTQALLYELVTKTFLFIGFSFKDPNLDRILKIIKQNFRGISPKNHYCFMKSINRNDYNEDDAFQKDMNLQTLKINYMIKSGINTILVDEFSQITDMLNYINERLKIDNVFISGAKYGDTKEKEYSFTKYECEFMFSLSQQLIQNGYNIYTGFGRGVGNYIVSGAISAINKTDINLINDRLNVHPMITADGVLNNDDKKILREKMIDASKHIICLYGHMNPSNSATDDKNNNDGVYTEYSIAKSKGKNIIALPHTGCTAKIIYDELCNDNKVFDEIANKDPKNSDDLKVLKDKKDQIINKVLELLEKEKKKLDQNLFSKLNFNNITSVTNVFISFSYKYHLNEANVLKEYVNNNNDFHVVNIENKKIEDEKKIYNWIDEKLLKTDVIILVIGKDSLESEYVKHEIKNSINLGKSFVTVFIDEEAQNPLTDENYTKKLRPIYELFPSCLYKHIKSEDDILNLVKKARKIGSFLNFGALRKIL